MDKEEFTVNENESREALKQLQAEIFSGNVEDLAFALGRPVEEVQDWLGGGEIDDDAQMKINGLVKERLSN